jgi:hypothetical protein
MDAGESPTRPGQESSEAPENPGNLLISHLPAEVQARILARAEVARKAAADYWDHAEKDNAKSAT